MAEMRDELKALLQQLLQDSGVELAGIGAILLAPAGPQFMAIERNSRQGFQQDSQQPCA